MSTIIKMKSGLSDNLPRLSVGECAYTTDKKHFYVGGVSENYDITPIGKNLITNGNFQVPIEDLDVDSRIVEPGNGAYVFGNFYISNDSAASGNITIIRDVTTGFLEIQCDNARPKLEYRLLLPRYENSGEYIYISPLENEAVTLGFDTINNISQDINIQCGTEDNLNSDIIPMGSSRVAQTFQYNKSTPVGLGFPIMNYVIFKVMSNIAGTIKIGNCKVEVGKIFTNFTPNSLPEDISILNETCKVIKNCCRAICVQNDTLLFDIDSHIPLYYSTYNISSKIISCTVCNLQGVTQTGFSSTIQTINNKLIMECSKINHGLSDARVTMDIRLYLRP